MSCPEPPRLRIRVVCLRPGATFDRLLLLPAGASVGEAVAASGVQETAAEPAAALQAIGVFGRLRLPADPLRDGDRVEIYRSLSIDPKAARRIRAAVRRRRRTRRAQETA
jgi:hypothetical protein